MDCVEWHKGKTGRGYGVCYPFGRDKQVLAHRRVYELMYGPIPEDMVVCHKCDNRGCVNINHLFLGTQKDNIKDMFAKGRQHDRRGDRGNASKLSEKQVLEIKAFIGKLKYKEIAKKYNVSETAIADIKLKRTWGHVV